VVPLDGAPPPGPLVITPVDPKVLVEVHGLGVVDRGGVTYALGLADRLGYRRLGPDVIENTNALPRAYVLPRAQSFSPAHRPELTVTQLATSDDIDLHAMVLIEGDPSTPSDPGDPAQPAQPAAVEDLGPNAVRVRASASTPGYLILDDLYQRGWSARVDGQPARVYVANALFRAVAIEPGQHVVEFRYQPTSLLVGASVSALSGLVVLAAIVVSYVRFRLRR
jgi:hypothetical protein